jgi:hypothetical protein
MVRDLIDGGAYHWYLDRGCDYLKRDIFEYNNGSWTENTALTHAQERGHVEIVAMLLEAECSTQSARYAVRARRFTRSGLSRATGAHLERHTPRTAHLKHGGNHGAAVQAGEVVAKRS